MTSATRTVYRFFQRLPVRNGGWDGGWDGGRDGGASGGCITFVGEMPAAPPPDVDDRKGCQGADEAVAGKGVGCCGVNRAGDTVPELPGAAVSVGILPE